MELGDSEIFWFEKDDVSNFDSKVLSKHEVNFTQHPYILML